MPSLRGPPLTTLFKLHPHIGRKVCVSRMPRCEHGPYHLRSARASCLPVSAPGGAVTVALLEGFSIGNVLVFCMS